MTTAREIKGYYGNRKTQCTILVFNDSYLNWYCVEGSVTVNATYDDIEENCNVEELKDIDCFTWSSAIETTEQLEEAVKY